MHHEDRENVRAVEQDGRLEVITGCISGVCECGCGGTTKISPYNDAHNGWRKGVPRRFLRGHHRRLGLCGLKRLPPETGYNVESRGFTTDCWIWQRAKMPRGYGVIGAGKLAHRYFYEKAHGPIPKGLDLDHLCRVKDCCNPEHLEAVTPATNVHRGAQTKLTLAQVEVIRSLKDRPKSLALKFGITSDYVHKIRAGRTWKPEKLRGVA